MMRVVYRTIVLALVAMALIVVAFFFKLPPAKAAARSVHVIIKNDTERNLTNVSVSVQHGIVTKNPPNSIPPSEAGELFAESQGVLTGTEGTVTYQLDGLNGTASFHWDNPYAGSNSANGSAPAGFQVEQIGDTGNRTLVFFSIHSVNQPVASCNPDWVIRHLGTHAEDQLDGVDKAVGFLTTPFKRMGIGGWVDTGCEATAEGWPVRDAQHSTDGFWTIDVRLSQFAINGRNISNDQRRFVRIEVEPNTPAHQSAAAKANLFIRFKGRVLIDTHHGDELIEVHPWDPITLAPEAPTQFLGTFGTTPVNYHPAFVYAIANNGNLLWYRQETNASKWSGPRQVGNGWKFKDVIPAGGNSFYALAEDGTLKWYRHDGFNDGSVAWKGPVDVGSGWNFAKIFSGGDGLVYAIKNDGTLLWYRHDGFADGGGVNTWEGPKVVGSSWLQFKHVFSGGQGIIYAVKPDGQLLWYRHDGYATGDSKWSGPLKVGSGWQNFRAIIPVGDGIILGVTDDGRMLWYKHKDYLTGTSNPGVMRPSGPGVKGQVVAGATVSGIAHWEGPVQIGSGWQGFQKVIALIPSTPAGPR